MKPVIFLDFDGVLTTLATNFHHGNPACVAALNRLTEASGARLVVTSSWRSTLPGTRALLRTWGVTAPVIGLTPRLHRSTGDGIQRGDEIRAWLDTHGARPFVILDDDDDMGALADHLVRTTSALGLTDNEAACAQGLLASAPAAEIPHLGSQVAIFAT